MTNDQDKQETRELVIGDVVESEKKPKEPSKDQEDEQPQEQKR